MAELSEGARQKLAGKNFAFLATVHEDGSPQITPVWIDVEGNDVLVNTAVGRAKEQHTRRDPRVGVSVVDWENPYDQVEIRGRVVDFVEGEEADRHIDKLARKYLGVDDYPNRTPEEKRVILRIRPERVSG